MFLAARGGARGGRGRGGRGRGRNGPVQTFVTCLRCGMVGHSRPQCRMPKVQCAHCCADHLSALCPKGPGGTQRDTLTQGARNLLDQDVQNSQGANAAGHAPLARPVCMG